MNLAGKVDSIPAETLHQAKTHIHYAEHCIGVPQPIIALAWVLSMNVAISRGRSWFWCIVVSLAERAACSPVGKPGVQTDSVECVAAGQSSHIVVVL